MTTSHLKSSLTQTKPYGCRFSSSSWGVNLMPLWFTYSSSFSLSTGSSGTGDLFSTGGSGNSGVGCGSVENWDCFCDRQWLRRPPCDCLLKDYFHRVDISSEWLYPPNGYVHQVTMSLGGYVHHSPSFFSVSPSSLSSTLLTHFSSSCVIDVFPLAARSIEECLPCFLVGLFTGSTGSIVISASFIKFLSWLKTKTNVWISNQLPQTR